MTEQQRFNAIFSRIQALYDKTFPASAGWRPNIQVTQMGTATHSPEYRALQMSNMMRAIEISRIEGGSTALQSGMNIKDIDKLMSSQGDASLFRELEPFSLRGFSMPQEVARAENWLARQTGDTVFFARKTAEAGRALTASTRAMEEFTRSVNQRLKAAGITIPEGGIPMSLLNATEQARFEALNNNALASNNNLMAALHAEHPTLSYEDIKAKADQMRTAAETSIRGRTPAPTRIIHPWNDPSVPRINRGFEWFGLPPGLGDPGDLRLPTPGRIETRAPDAVIGRARQFVEAQHGDYREPAPEDLTGSGVGARAAQRGTPTRTVG